MENLLGLDLNELVSKQVSEKLTEMEETIGSQADFISSLSKSKTVLEKQLKEVATAEALLIFMKQAFYKLEPVKEDREKNIYGKTLGEVKYEYIQNILLSVFGLPNKGHVNRWGNFATALSINYYDHKEIVLLLLSAITDDQKSISFIKNYVLPKDWAKQDVLAFVKNPQYNTNGVMFGESQYWVESGGEKSNMPYNQIMVNPHIIEDDVFDELVNTIKTKRSSNYFYLFAICRYQKLSQAQINKLAYTLPDLHKDVLQYETVKEFIKLNMANLPKTVVDYLHGFASSDNQFKDFAWQNFPMEYQTKYLMNIDFDACMKILNNYDCKWTSEEKQAFLKKKLNKK